MEFGSPMVNQQIKTKREIIIPMRVYSLNDIYDIFGCIFGYMTLNDGLRLQIEAMDGKFEKIGNDWYYSHMRLTVK